MKARFSINASALLPVAALAAAAVWPGAAHALVCSALDRYPCVYHPFHQVCSVFSHRPCTPELEYPFSEQLQLTIVTRDREPDRARGHDEAAGEAAEKLDTIGAVFAALRSCWIPPTKQDSRPGAQ